MPQRRRVVSIIASAAALAPLGAWAAAAAAQRAPAGKTEPVEPVEPVTWRGQAMGALASLTLVHPDRAAAQAAIAQCVAEVDRLESILSLYRPESALSRLNARGDLHAPPQALVEVLSFSLSLAQRSGGAFDPTVQPLYRLYAEHFAHPGADARGPSAQAVARVLRSVDFRAVELRSDRIRLARPGMALTLNGVAQGYITDRVTELLRASGFQHVLVDLGEARAAGRRADGEPWRAGIADPQSPQRVLHELALGEGRGEWAALATSAGSGTRFGPDPRLHHLLDPHSGRSANHHASVSVAAPRAMLADGLSTTLSVLPPARAGALLAAYPDTRAWFVDPLGRVSEHPTG